VSETPVPLLSVVVPIYNVGTYLAPCLESLSAGTLRDLEIICVDDGSTDGSGEVADEFASSDSRIRVLHVQNGGLGRARNIGADAATGRYLAFVDSDDRVPPRAYEQLCGSLEASGSDIATGRVGRFTDTRSWRSGLHATAIPRAARATHISKVPALVYDTTALNKVFRRSFWDAHDLRFPEGVLYEDMPLTIPAHVLASSVDLLTSVVYEWRERGDGSMSITQRRAELKNLQDRLSALEYVKDFLAGHDLPKAQQAHDRKVLTLDLPLYLWVLDVADAEYRQLFAEHVRAYLEHVDEDSLAAVPVWERVAFELLLRGRVEETIQLVRDRSAAKTSFEVHRKRTRLLAELPYLGDPAVGVPDAAYDVTNRLPVRTTIDELAVDGAALTVTGYALIDKVPFEHPWSALRYLHLRDGSGHTVRALARHYRRPDATATFGSATAAYDLSGYRLRIPFKRLRAPETGVAHYTAQMKIVTPAARRGVPLERGRYGGRQSPVLTHVTADGTYVAAWASPGGGLRVAARRDYALAERIWFGDGGETLVCALRFSTAPAPAAVLRWRSDDEGVAPIDAVLERDGSDPLCFTARTSLGDSRVIDAGGGQRTWRPSVEPPGGDGSHATAVVAAPKGSLPKQEDVGRGRQLSVRFGTAGQLLLATHAPRVIVTGAQWEAGRLVVTVRPPHDVPAGELTVVLSRGGNVVEPVASRTHGDEIEVAFEVLRPAEKWSIAPGTWGLRVDRGDPLAPENLHLDVEESAIRAATAGTDEPTALVRTSAQRLNVTVWSQRDSERGLYHQTRLAGATYAAARNTPLRDAVLFQSWAGKQYSDSPRALYEEMRRQGRDERAIWVRRDTSVEVPAGTPSVLFGSRDYFEAMATARYVVSNDAMPTFYEKRAGSRYLQTWHGTPLKRIAFDIENAQFGNKNYLAEFAVEVTKWDQLISPNAFSTEVFRRAFGYDGAILETGYPRNDLFYAPDVEERRQRVRDGLGLKPDQRVILWAPTWREDQRDSAGRYTLPLPFDLTTWDRILRPDDVLLFRGHQLLQQTVSGMLRGLRQVRNVTLYPDIQELYLAADMLITDYSSVMFDFANTRRPMIFYAWDLEHYREHLRGFYLDFEKTVPGPIVTDLEQLRELLTHPAVGEGHEQAYARFVERFCGLEDGSASARALSALFDG